MFSEMFYDGVRSHFLLKLKISMLYLSQICFGYICFTHQICNLSKIVPIILLFGENSWHVWQIPRALWLT